MFLNLTGTVGLEAEMLVPQMVAWQYEYDPDGSLAQRTDCQATHTWTAGGQFSIQVQGVNLSTSSVWSPSDNLLISTYSIQTALEMPILLGASANFATDSSYISSNTVNEPLTGRSSGTSHIVHWGYQGTNIAPSSFTVLYLGPQGPGGADASPTPELNSSDLISYSTSTTPIGTIALNLLEHGTTSYTDANGNFVAENGRWLAYDFENRPIDLVTQDGTLDQFQYDYQGRRTQQIVTPISQSSQTTTYAGGGYEVSGSTITKYISAGSLRVAMLLNGSTAYFLPDYLGSTNRLVNAKKGVVRTNDYLPFGFMYLTSGAVDDEHKYTGKRLDASTGLYYYGARYYDPLLGQFVSPDSLLQNTYDPQLLNRYVYSRNNPIKLLDTNGHFVEIPVFTFAGALIGGLGYESYTAYRYLEYGEGSQADISAAFWTGARVGGAIGLGYATGTALVSPGMGFFMGGTWGATAAGYSPPQSLAIGVTAGAYGPIAAAGTLYSLYQLDQSATEAMSNLPGASQAQYAIDQFEANPFMTNPGQAVFWSNIPGGQSAADAWATLNGGITLDQLNSARGNVLPPWDPDNPESVADWQWGSSLFAQGASGNVNVLQGNEPPNPDSMWLQNEYPNLQNVNSITSVNITTDPNQSTPLSLPPDFADPGDF